jgi:hypothetical protein
MCIAELLNRTFYKTIKYVSSIILFKRQELRHKKKALKAGRLLGNGLKVYMMILIGTK